MALAAWLDAERTGVEPEWKDIDAINVNNAISFTPMLLSSGVSVVPPALLRQLFVADATVPALRSTSESVVRLFETQVRPLVLARVVALDDVQRRVVETYRSEFAQLSDTTRRYQTMLATIHDELAAAGF